MGLKFGDAPASFGGPLISNNTLVQINGPPYVLTVTENDEEFILTISISESQSYILLIDD